MRVQPAYVVEELVAGHAGQRLSRKHERHLFACVLQVGQPPRGLVRIGQALHAVVAAVAPGELGLDLLEDVRMLVDGNQDRKSHRTQPTPSLRAEPVG
jgi:hypothetical protein